MHVQGVIEVREDSWVGATDLPHLPPAACSPVFGVPERVATSASVADPIAPERGLPDQRSSLLDQHYFKDASSVYGDTGPWHHATGESWVLVEELPASVRADERWTDVLATIAEYEPEYGPDGVRLVVWFET